MNNKLFWLAALTLSCAAQSRLIDTDQSTIGATNQNQSDKSYTTQLLSLQFKSPVPIRRIGSSPLLAVPFQCTPDGSVFIDTLDPRNAMARTLYSLLDKDVSTFPLSAINDLDGLELTDYFPGSSTVDLLVQAYRKSSSRNRSAVGTGAQETNVEHVAHHFFVAEFGRQGSYEKSVQLDVDFPLFRLAVLPSGEFLVTGYDSAIDSERLLVLDDAGRVLKSIDQPLSAQERTARRDAAPYARMLGGAKSAGMTNFVGYKDSVLAWRAGTNDPILEIREGGSTREVPITIPSGTLIADVLPSDDQWVIHVQSASLPENGPRDLSDYAYYEVSPLDGSPLRKLTIMNREVGSLACKTRGNFVAFSTDKDKKLIEFVAPDR